MTKYDLEIRPATQADLVLFYGKPPIKTTRALSLYIDGQIMAVAGVYLDDCCYVAFSEMKDELRPRKKDIMRFARVAMQLVKEYNNVVAVASPSERNSQALLKRLGFVHTGRATQGEVFTWQG